MIINKIDKVLLKSKIFKSKYVYIYCDLRNLLNHFKRTPEKGVEKFLNLFKRRGITCITPAFSYTTKGRFDLKNTKSRVGFLSNYIIKKEKFVRSKHPLFSYVAVGKNKKILTKLGKSAFGKMSLHEKLLDEKCYFLNLNRPLKNGNTLIHHIEQKNKADYRYEKTFNTRIYDGKKYYGKNYKAFVRINMKSHHTEATFKKAYDKIKKRKYFIKEKISDLEILIYPYKQFYFDINKLYNQHPQIFIKKNN